MLGFVPNALLTLAKRPAILRALGQLVRAVLREGQLDPPLRMLVAEVASSAAGCQYCQAHAAIGASRFGVGTDKIEAVWDFEHSGVFDDRERAALRLARDAASVPNAVGPEHFKDLSPHFSETEILELVAVVSLFGWFNRWNDTLATELEEPALLFGSRHLAGPPGKRESANRAPIPKCPTRGTTAIGFQ